MNLALQGGGAHGAFTWGVLDALLEDGCTDFHAISATSAGAMNAVVLAQGLSAGGPEGAREALAKFWEMVAEKAPFDMSSGGDADGITLSPAAKIMMHWARYFSPYQFNPFDLNPLRDVVNELIDFKRLRRRSPVKLFIAATQASTGKLRLFRERELTADMLMASACLPTLHHAIEIDGEPYWDGGYTANPAVFPLLYDDATRDVLLVVLSAFYHGDTPRSADGIRDRALELTFNSNFLREMRMLAHARDFAAASLLPLGRLERRLTRARFHMIEAKDVLGELPTETKLIAHLPFLTSLRDGGRECAKAWMKKHAGRVGQRSTIDLRKLFC